MKRAWRYRCEYLLLRGAEWGVNRVPRRLALWLGARLGDFLYLAGYYRRIVRRNFAFVGLWSAAEQRQIMRRLYRNMGRYALDFLRQSGELPPVTVVNEELIAEQMAPGKGAIGVLAHLGNWEVLVRVFGRKLGCLAVVAKQMKNPHVEGWLQKHRERAGCTVLLSKQVLRPALRLLREGRVLAFLIDQYAGDMGTPALFLGKKTSTVRTVAGLHVRTGCGILPVYALLQADGSYRVVIEPAPPLPATPADRDALVSAVQEQHNAIVSRWVQEHPDHWFGWFHRRFKDLIKY